MIISRFPGVASHVNSAEIGLNNNSWKIISKASESGMAKNYWAIGDTKEIVMNGTVGATTFNNLSIWVYIIGFDHNNNVEGSGRTHFQIGKTAQTNGIDIALVDSMYSITTENAGYFNMNYSNTNVGGWKDSKMRTILLGSQYEPSTPYSNSLMAALPSDLLEVMKPVSKYSDNVGGSSNATNNITITTDYLWLLSEYEVLGATTCANSAEGNYQRQYDYYANGNSKAKYKHNDTSSGAYWLLRSVYASNSTSFCEINKSGAAGTNNAYGSSGISPAFCV